MEGFVYTVPMALTDYIPVVLFGISALLLCRDLKNKMTKGVFVTLKLGAVVAFLAGFFKATYKLLYASGLCDFTALSDEQKHTCVVAATLCDADGNAVSEQVVRFVKSKDFCYLKPCITAQLDGDTLTLQADGFADSVWLEFGHTDCVFSRNGFSLTGEPVTVTLSCVEGTPSIEDLTMTCLNDTM